VDDRHTATAGICLVQCSRTIFRSLLPTTTRGPVSIAAKQLLREVIEHLPDDATIEDAMVRLCFLAKVTRGLDAADRGAVVTHEEARRAVLGEDGTATRR
jgi:predicted transcriptional regulator